jgi:hypothetical protein
LNKDGTAKEKKREENDHVLCKQFDVGAHSSIGLFHKKVKLAEHNQIKQMGGILYKI